MTLRSLLRNTESFFGSDSNCTSTFALPSSSETTSLVVELMLQGQSKKGYLLDICFQKTSESTELFSTRHTSPILKLFAIYKIRGL